MDKRSCAVCGREYIPTAYNQRRCPACVKARRMKCASCGAIYTASAYNRPGNRSHCPACLNKLRGANNTHAAHVQRAAAREAAFEAKSRAGRVNIRKALAVREDRPRTAKNSHENAHAKIWLLRDPRGNTVEVRNIRAFVRERPEDFPNETAAIKSFYIISQTLQGRAHVRHPQYSYRGWTLVCPPTTPDDVADRKAYRDLKEVRRAEIDAPPPDETLSPDREEKVNS